MSDITKTNLNNIEYLTDSNYFKVIKYIKEYDFANGCEQNEKIKILKYDVIFSDVHFFHKNIFKYEPDAKIRIDSIKKELYSVEEKFNILLNIEEEINSFLNSDLDIEKNTSLSKYTLEILKEDLISAIYEIFVDLNTINNHSNLESYYGIGFNLVNLGDYIFHINEEKYNLFKKIVIDTKGSIETIFKENMNKIIKDLNIECISEISTNFILGNHDFYKEQNISDFLGDIEYNNGGTKVIYNVSYDKYCDFATSIIIDKKNQEITYIIYTHYPLGSGLLSNYGEEYFVMNKLKGIEDKITKIFLEETKTHNTIGYKHNIYNFHGHIHGNQLELEPVLKNIINNLLIEINPANINNDIKFINCSIDRIKNS